MLQNDIPGCQGLYDPAFEHDSCGVGFIVDQKGRKSHAIVSQAVEILNNLHHRSACGCEAETGDGAGILIQMPHHFFRDYMAELKFDLPEFGLYGAGLVFLPADPEARFRCEWFFEQVAREEGSEVIGWRTVPTDSSSLGLSAKAAEPVIRQVFVKRNAELSDEEAFERKLYVIRRRVERAVAQLGASVAGKFYICSLSHRTLVYKGMLRSDQLIQFYPDLISPFMESSLAMVHSRFSTNTFPTWARAHPYRYLSHNGEINTLRGNLNWMRARQSMLKSRLFGEDLRKVFPVIDESGSDSAMLDNTLELLLLAGRSLPHAMMMMIPEPWDRHEAMSETKKDFYRYHSCLMEPWDGPASIAFTDGKRIGAVLDRNGLRPSRYYETKDGLVVMASEVGVLDIPPERVLRKGRLQPGRMLLVDTEAGRIISDAEVKEQIARENPYGDWVRRNQVSLSELPDPEHTPVLDGETVRLRQLAFGYTNEDLRVVIGPMALTGVEPIGSMGNDAPLAVLSEHSQLLYNYFKQLFAQVTNPPVDAIREDLIMSSEMTIGPERNLLEPEAESARQIKLTSPILSNEDLEKLRGLDGSKLGPHGVTGFRSETLPMLFDVQAGGEGLELALKRLCRDADRAIESKCEILILSDRGVDRDHAPIPALLALGAVHHHLVNEETRTRVGLVVESGEPREVHHFALLVGYGASAINPYLVFETLDDMIGSVLLADVNHRTAVDNYKKAIAKGVVKVMSKMGISTVQSYHGAQIFEAIGLDQSLVDRYFHGTPSRIGGIGLELIAEEVRMRHEKAFPQGPFEIRQLDDGGRFQWRQGGEHHQFNPESLHWLQQACRSNSVESFKKFSRLANGESSSLSTLRGLFKLRPAKQAVPIDQVESVASIVRRFKAGAMSYGSISKEAHETLAIAMNRIGGRSNTGEGGEDPSRYNRSENGDSKNSSIKQVASGRFGVTSEYLVQAKELQIKMAQGAKPGEGGQLPGYKVYPEIAEVRHSTPGVGLISPPPHHDIYSIEDLAQLIHDLKNANSRARINVKLVAEVGVGTIAAGVAKAHADVILISGHDGGTGASPLTSIKHAGVPWELGLSETQQVLVLNDLRSRVTLEVDGQLKTGRDVVVAALLGAEEFGFGTAPLVALGCIMMRKCHSNTCPVGVATQDPRLRKKFSGDPEHVANFFYLVAEEVREIMAELGFCTINEMIGRSDRLEFKPALDHWKARGLDLSKILHQPRIPAYVGRRFSVPQDHGLEKALDNVSLLRICRPALEKLTPVSASVAIRNTNRVVGTILGSEVTRRYGSKGLPDGTISLLFKGSAGQSLGAFLPPGITISLEGDANDYVGKGLSGGRIVVFPPRGATFVPEENVIIGNVAFYGATAGEAYVNGMAGERFCVRNSGLHAVVEAVGDHGCEYMTGGRVVVLGSTGRNFAAGMSGGIAYVFDEVGDFSVRCNHELVRLFGLEDAEEQEIVRAMLQRHVNYTGSKHAWKLLEAWPETVERFVKVYPNDYRRVLEAREQKRAEGLSEQEAMMAAFEQNSLDSLRAGGK